jgi:hypothetical protein
MIKLTAPNESLPWAEGTSSPQVAHLRSEISRTVAEATQQAIKAQRWSAFWNGAFISLGLPGAILAALSGATGLASTHTRVLAAGLALAAACLTAASGFLRSDTRALEARRRGSAWRVLEADTRLMAALDGYGSPQDIANAWSVLLDQRKSILAGDYEAALGMSHGKPIKFAGPYISGEAVAGEE